MLSQLSFKKSARSATGFFLERVVSNIHAPNRAVVFWRPLLPVARRPWAAVGARGPARVGAWRGLPSRRELAAIAGTCRQRSRGSASDERRGFVVGEFELHAGQSTSLFSSPEKLPKRHS
jgi:hypothetical protein